MHRSVPSFSPCSSAGYISVAPATRWDASHIRLALRHACLALLYTCFALLCIPAQAASAQTASGPSAAPGSSSSSSGVLQLLPELEQEAATLSMDVGRLRIEKWKTDSGTKQQSTANMMSIQRNLTSALPELIQQVRANPQSLAASFKLYRNLSALYDVLAGLSESAGAFGGKGEFQALATDFSNLDGLRRNYGNALEAMTAAADSQLASTHPRAGAPAANGAPKKIVVDDNAPAPAPKKRKKKKAASASPAATPQKQ